MNKKIIFAFSFLFFLFCFFFLYFFGYPFYVVQKWVNLYASWEYLEAQDTFSREENSSLKDSAQFWRWGSFYKNQDYSGAVNSFLSTSTWSYSFESLHNLGNTLYMLGSWATTPQEKLQYWNQSLSFYSGALQIQTESKPTQENYEFVKKKIQELSGQQKKDDSQNQKSQSGSSDKGSPWDKGQSQQKWEKEKQNQSGESWSGWQSDKQQNWNSSWPSQSQSLQQPKRDEQYQLHTWSQVWNLSESEKEELKNYQSYLEQLQKQNQQFFNKKPSTDSSDPFWAFVDPFTGKPLFQDNLNQNEKDW